MGNRCCGSLKPPTVSPEPPELPGPEERNAMLAELRVLRRKPDKTRAERKRQDELTAVLHARAAPVPDLDFSHLVCG